MSISFDKVTIKNELVFRNLWQFFGYDFSEMNNMDLNEEGIFVLPPDYHEFIEDDQYCSYIIKVDGNHAGLAVIKFIEEESVNYFRHFFIIRKFRNKGIGKSVVHKIVDLYPGKWRVSQFDYNKPAIHFWRKSVGAYTCDNYIEVRRSDGKGPQQEFKCRLSTQNCV